MRRSALIVATAVASLLALATLAGCSREKIDWKSAEAADTVESYDHFIERHPESALATQARARVAQLNEDRDWKKATGADTADGYRQFLAQHEGGKWAEEARIRLENFSLDGTASGPAKPGNDVAPAVATTPSTPPAKPAAPPAAAPAKPALAAAEPKPSTAMKPAATTKPAAAPEKHVAAATTPAPAAVPAVPASSGQFGIQLGAFRSQDAALKNWKQLQVKHDSELHGLFAHAVPLKQGSDQLFRLQAPVGDEARARAICASLAKQSQPCVVVLPPEGQH